MTKVRSDTRSRLSSGQTRNTSVLLEVWRGNDSVLSQPLDPHVLPRGCNRLFPHSALPARPIGCAVGMHARATSYGEGSRFTLGWGTHEEHDNTLSYSSDATSELRLSANIYCNHVFAIARHHGVPSTHIAYYNEGYFIISKYCIFRIFTLLIRDMTNYIINP